MIRLKNNPKMAGLLAVTLGAALAAIVSLSIPALANGKMVNAPHQGTDGISTNWAGYVVPSTDGSVSNVSGNWVVPTANESGYSAIWVGMDGYSSSTAEQIGTQQDFVNGKAQYHAWFEMYPNPPQQIDRTVNPGDNISASVQYANGTFTLTLQDNNWATPFSVNETPANALQRNSAEWIVEAPSTTLGILPLANFGSVNFNSMQATIGNLTGTLNNWTPVTLNMGTRNGTLLVQTGALNSTGDTFTATYVARSISIKPVPARGNPDDDDDKDDSHGKSEESHGRHLGWEKILSKSDDSHGRHLGWAKISGKED